MRESNDCADNNGLWGFRESTAEASSLHRKPVDRWRVGLHFKAGFRFGLGMAQMFIAVFSIVLLLKTSVNRWSLLPLLFTTLYGGQSSTVSCQAAELDVDLCGHSG